MCGHLRGQHMAICKDKHMYVEVKTYKLGSAPIICPD